MHWNRPPTMIATWHPKTHGSKRQLRLDGDISRLISCERWTLVHQEKMNYMNAFASLRTVEFLIRFEADASKKYSSFPGALEYIARDRLA